MCLMVLKHADLCYATAQGSAAVAWWDRRVMQELQGQRRRRSDGERVVGVRDTGRDGVRCAC